MFEFGEHPALRTGSDEYGKTVYQCGSWTWTVAPGSVYLTPTLHASPEEARAVFEAEKKTYCDWSIS